MTSGEEWAKELAQTGRVEFVQRRQHVAMAVVVIALLAIVPILVTLRWLPRDDIPAVLIIASVLCLAIAPIAVPAIVEHNLHAGPPLVVDRLGIDIAGSPRVQIPWSDLASALPAGQEYSRAVPFVDVATSAAFAASYRQERGRYRRIIDAVTPFPFTRFRLLVPADAEAGELAQWLDYEIRKRRPNSG